MDNHLKNRIYPNYVEQRMQEVNSLPAKPLPEFAEEYLSVRPNQRETVEASYNDWKNLAREWVNNSANFHLAMEFINGHPAMWNFKFHGDMKSVQEEGSIVADEFLKNSSLVMNNGVEFGVFYTNYSFDTKGNMTFLDAEVGDAIPPFRVSSYHNYMLDYASSSIEECYVGIAVNLFKIFGVGDQGMEWEEYMKNQEDMRGKE